MPTASSVETRSRLIDPFSRVIDYLRVSLTDRCNFRCVYCIPDRYARFTPSDQALSDGELLRVLKVFARLGTSKIRLTGGEPLVREGIVPLIERISALEGIEDLALSTNGMLLGPMARDLRRAGLDRVNISLDTLDAERFQEITRKGNLATVLEGIGACLREGLEPIKINVVVVRSVNDREIGAFADWTREHPVHVRFIELMPMGDEGFFSADRRVSFEETFEAAGPLEEIGSSRKPKGNGPARYFRKPGGRGTVGFISALSCNFCGQCNRMRLSCKGEVIPCLDGEGAVDLREALRSGGEDADLERLIRGAVAGKPEKHHMLEREADLTLNARTMCQIGG